MGGGSEQGGGAWDKRGDLSAMLRKGGESVPSIERIAGMLGREQLIGILIGRE